MKNSSLRSRKTRFVHRPALASCYRPLVSFHSFVSCSFLPSVVGCRLSGLLLAVRAYALLHSNAVSSSHAADTPSKAAQPNNIRSSSPARNFPTRLRARLGTLCGVTTSRTGERMHNLSSKLPSSGATRPRIARHSCSYNSYGGHGAKRLRGVVVALSGAL